MLSKNLKTNSLHLGVGGSGFCSPPQEHLGTHRAVGIDVRALQCNGDAVEEDENQNHVIKHLVCDDFLAVGPEAESKARGAGQLPPRIPNIPLLLGQ